MAKTKRPESHGLSGRFSLASQDLLDLVLQDLLEAGRLNVLEHRRAWRQPKRVFKGYVEGPVANRRAVISGRGIVIVWSQGLRRAI